MTNPTKSPRKSKPASPVADVRRQLFESRKAIELLPADSKSAELAMPLLAKIDADLAELESQEQAAAASPPTAKLKPKAKAAKKDDGKFPLIEREDGRYCKTARINGKRKMFYFGTTAVPDAALAKYKREWP